MLLERKQGWASSSLFGKNQLAKEREAGVFDLTCNYCIAYFLHRFSYKKKVNICLLFKLALRIGKLSSWGICIYIYISEYNIFLFLWEKKTLK